MAKLWQDPATGGWVVESGAYRDVFGTYAGAREIHDRLDKLEAFVSITGACRLAISQLKMDRALGFSWGDEAEAIARLRTALARRRGLLGDLKRARMLDGLRAAIGR